MSPVAHPRSLAGATIVQLVPDLRDNPGGNAAIDIAMMLLTAGARAIVAGDDGPLVRELRDFGGEFIPMPNDTLNPLRVLANARALARLIADERVDIIHAQSAGSAWSALVATHKQPVYLVTSFPDRLPGHSWPGTMLRSSLARGDRVVAPSGYVSRAMIDRYRLAPDRITVIPRAVDTARFSPAAIDAGRVDRLRHAWAVAPGTRIVLVPGRIVPWNGQMSVVDAARLLVASGERDVAVVFAGDDRVDQRYAGTLRRQAQAHGIEMLCRFVGMCADMPAAMAAADVVVVPSLEPPLSGRVAAEAQALGRPLVTTNVGVLPENLLCPPRMPDDLRTGWLVQPGNAVELSNAIRAALALDVTAYAALGARARQFAEFMFSPQSVAGAVRGVYTSLLARDA